MTRARPDLSQLSAIARQAAQARDWATVGNCAKRILEQDKNSPEGFFLSGLALKSQGQVNQAVSQFSRALSIDAGRYDAAVELANQYANLLRHREALDLLQRYAPRLSNSPLYLDMAANTYSRLGLHAQAWPLYQQANALQPGIDQFQANLAACAVYLGNIEEAKALYQGLLRRHPGHQRNHFELSRLEKAKDVSHVEQMKAVLQSSQLPPERNIFLYYAIGKELEDLERWREAFDYYKLAGDTVTAMADYDVGADIALMDKIIEVCDADWLAAGSDIKNPAAQQRTPIFIVGLPRTGTTLTERILASHSRVESADESFFMKITLQRLSAGGGSESPGPAMIAAAAKTDPGLVAAGYLDAVDYRLSGKPMFIDKLPENFLYLGFIAKAFPQARLVHLRRNPMDACFAMYKQSFFKFAYTLENVGRYYVAYERLHQHWKKVLKDRLVEVEYESLVAEPEGQTRILLDKLGLDFEQACLDFDQNRTPSATASAVQVREKVHTRSVNRWQNFSSQLQPLKDYLEKAGIAI